MRRYYDSISKKIIEKYVTKFVNKLIRDNHATEEFKIIEVKPRKDSAVVTYDGTMREEVANNIISSKSLEIDGNEIKIVAKKYMLVDSRADTLEATIVHTANELYKKKDKFGLGLSQKDLDEIIHDIDQSPVFKRLVEQSVRNWIKRQEDLNV